MRGLFLCIFVVSACTPVFPLEILDGGRPDAHQAVDADTTDASSDAGPSDGGRRAEGADGGALTDGSVLGDGGALLDGGTLVDAGAAIDGGMGVDAASAVDAGTAIDAGRSDGGRADGGVDAGRDSGSVCTDCVDYYHGYFGAGQVVCRVNREGDFEVRCAERFHYGDIIEVEARPAVPDTWQGWECFGSASHLHGSTQLTIEFVLTAPTGTDANFDPDRSID